MRSVRTYICVGVIAFGFVFGWQKWQPVVGAQGGAPAAQPVVSQAVGFAMTPPLRDIIAQQAASPQPKSESRRRPGTYRVPNKLLPQKLSQNFSAVATTDGVLQGRAVPSPSMPSPSLTFLGVESLDNVNNFGNVFVPPDTNGDVGPNHYVQFVNSLFRVYTKTGTALTPATKASSLFGFLGGACAAQDDGDTAALYDPLADRWLLSQFCVFVANPNNHQMIAVSASGDPLGNWFVYDFMMPNNKINDYPHFGVWPDAYYMTDNQFAQQPPNPYEGGGAFAFNRAKMLAGDPSANYIYFDLFSVNPNLGGMLPSNLEGLTPPPAGTPNYFANYTADEYGDPSDAMQVWQFHANFAQPSASTFTLLTTLPVAAFDPRSPISTATAEQPSPAIDSEYLSVIQDRLMYPLNYRNFGSYESLVVTHTVNVSGLIPTTAMNHQAGIRYYEFRRALPGGTWVVNEQATFAPGAGNGATGLNRFMGSASMDGAGNLAVGYSASSTTIKPSIYWAGRLATDPSGGLGQGEATMFAGTGSQLDVHTRWGDYSSMSVDPADDCTFWFTSEYYLAVNEFFIPGFIWNTRIGRFNFGAGPCAPQVPGWITGSVVDGITGSPVTGAYIYVDGILYGATNASGTYTVLAKAGTHSVRASGPNYSSDQENGIVVTSGLATTTASTLTIRSLTGSYAASAAVPASLGAVPDNNCAVGRDVQFSVSGLVRPVASVRVSFTMNPTHTQVGDLIVTLRSPGGVTTHQLFGRTGQTPDVSAGDDSNVAGPYSFRDQTSGNWWQAAALAGPGASVPAGNYRTTGPTAGESGVTNLDVTFGGLSPAQANGTWTLRFLDCATNETGAVSAASLEIAQSARAALDFEGNAQSDYVIARPSGGAYLWFILNASGLSGVSFGATATDVFTPGDYDGDGKTDVSVWRSDAIGAFYHLRSSDGVVAGVAFGTTGDNPTVTGDYDGDGRTDPAVVRNESGTLAWYMLRSTLGFTGLPFGLAGDFVAPGDWDGDGKWDQAVRRPSGGVSTFYINGSATGFSAFPWGLDTDAAASADYDGDGKADAAVVRNQSGSLFWYIRRSTDLGLTALQFGSAASDIPAPADYDGDGKMDVAIWRSSAVPGQTGFWVVRSSTGVVAFQPFGQPGDAVPAFVIVH